MKNLLIRSLSGTVYVALLLFAIFFETYGEVIFSLLMAVCLWEFSLLDNTKPSVLHSALLVGGGLFVYWGSVYLNLDLDLVGFFSALSCGMILGLIASLYNSNLFKKKLKVGLAFLYIGIPFLLIPSWLNELGPLSADLLVILLVIIWVNDSFAYLFGVSFGKHKFMPRISPKKSWEGFIGGAVMSLIIGILAYKFGFVEYLNLIEFEVFILMTIIAATFGDLVESKFKREANVKDSSCLIPGHGGFLDRLDSFIFALPVATLYVLLIN